MDLGKILAQLDNKKLQQGLQQMKKMLPKEQATQMENIVKNMNAKEIGQKLKNVDISKLKDALNKNPQLINKLKNNPNLMNNLSNMLDNQ